MLALKWFVASLVVSMTLPFASYAQTPATQNTTMTGILEPPELTGPPKPKAHKEPSEAEKALFEVIGVITKTPNDNDPEKLKAAKDALDKIIQQFPDFSAAFFFRVALSCEANSKDYPALIRDVDVALKYHGLAKYVVYPVTRSELYSLRGKIAYDSGDLQAAIKDLNQAMMLDHTISLFGAAVKPDRISEPCTWNKADLDTLVRRYPSDYRVHLYRGLYYSSAFSRGFQSQYQAPAIANFTQAAAVNPQSALAYYFLGAVSNRFPGAVSNRKKALLAFDKAIQLDPTLTVAYDERALMHLELKHTQEAIRDFDRVLELDREDGAAWLERGRAKLSVNDYTGAVSDFTEAIRHKDRLKSDGFLPYVYEDRADSYIKLAERDPADYESAIRDLTEAITLLLSGWVGGGWDLGEFRRIYPEYRRVPDDVLLRKLHHMFAEDLKYEAFAENVTQEHKMIINPAWVNMFKKRGDAYLELREYRRAFADYQRTRAMGNLSAVGMLGDIPRWVLIVKTAESGVYIDSETVDYPGPDTAQFWTRTVMKSAKGNGASTVSHYEVSCGSRTLNVLAFVDYDVKGKVTASSDVPRGRRGVVPDSIGEQLYSGMCH